jgi:Outer membrane protein TOM13
MSDIDPPSLSPQTESYAEEVSYPSDLPSSESSNSSTSIITFYKPPTILSLLRTTAINLILPFINGVMLGFGEIFAHELAFRWGWRGAKVNTYRFECWVDDLGISATKIRGTGCGSTAGGN